MDFALTDQQEAIRDAIAKICEGFPDAYWLKKDHDGGFPHDFHKAMADAGWLGICVPEEYGGSGLGITEAAIMMRAIAESGAGMSGASAVHINVFGLNPGRRVRHRGAAQAHAAADGRGPREGLLRRHRAQHRPQHHPAQDPRGAPRTTATSSTARRCGSRPRRSRTRFCCWRAPRRWRRCARRPMGSACSTPISTASKIKVHEIEKMGRKVVDSNELFFEDFEIPMEDRIGEEGKGFQYILRRHEPRAHPDRGRSRRPRQAARCRARPNTPRRASSSTGRSARTRASSIRSR